MPLKLNVGLSRKVGEANYGSRGASVNLELELESALADQPDRLHDRIRHLFRLARTSVDEELHGGNAPAAPPANGNGNGHQASRPRQARPATASQVRAIHAIAGRQRVDLTGLLQTRFHIGRPDDLSISQASGLIDELKSTGNGVGESR